MTPPVNPLALRRLRYARPGVERDARYDNAGAVYTYRMRTDNLERLAVHRCEDVPQAMGRRLYHVRTHGGCHAQCGRAVRVARDDPKHVVRTCFQGASKMGRAHVGTQV